MTKLEERLKEAWEERKESLPHVSYKSDRENFHAGAKFILELPELKALVDGLESYASGDHFVYHGNEDHAPDSVSGEPPNVMFGGAEGSEFQFEDGSWAQKKLEEWRSFIGEGGNENK